MSRIAVIYPNNTSGTNDKRILGEYDNLQLCDIYYYSDQTDKKRINKTDITLDLDDIKSRYEVILMVGAEVTKYVSGLMGGPQKLNGYTHKIGNNVFISMIDPKRALIYPMARKQILQAINSAYSTIDALREGKPIMACFEKEYKLIEDEQELYSILTLCLEAKVLITDIETSDLYPDKGYILGIAVGYKAHQGFYAPMHIWSERCIRLYTDLIYSKEIYTVCHNVSFEMKWLYYHLSIDMFKWANVHDTMFLHYVYDENSPADLKTLAVKYTDLGPYDIELDNKKKELAKKLKIKIADFTYDLIPIDILAPYACKDIDATAQIFKKFFGCIKKHQRIYDFLIHCAPAIAYLELQGGPINIDKVQDAISDYDEIIARLSAELFESEEVQELVQIQGKIFNPNSTQQVSRLLFEVAGLIPIKETASSTRANPKYSTDAEVLKILADEFPIAKKLLEYRKAMKFRNTYLVNIANKVSKDSRLRTGFNMARTSSGRLSSSGNINYQNIPRGKVIKQLFCARPGYKILQMDLGNAEVWVAAVEALDQYLLDAYKSDFHGYIAKTAFKLDCAPEVVKKMFPDKRQKAKAITFGILYGAQAKKIAEEIGCSTEEAQQLIDNYFEQAHQLKEWIEKCRSTIATTGQIKSAFDRTRRVPEVFSSNMGIKYHALNSAFNFVVQSSASDMNISAFAKIVRYIKAGNLQDICIPWNVVHDSMVWEVREDYVERLVHTIAIEVQNACREKYPHIDIPIKMDFELGGNWGYLEEYKTVSEWL